MPRAAFFLASPSFFVLFVAWPAASGLWFVQVKACAPWAAAHCKTRDYDGELNINPPTLCQ
jgi:hypothetical protein